MIPAVDHVLCSRGAYGINVLCLSAQYVKLDQWPVIYFPDIVTIAQCYCETLQYHTTIALVVGVFVLHSNIMYCSVQDTLCFLYWKV